VLTGILRADGALCTSFDAGARMDCVRHRVSAPHGIRIQPSPAGNIRNADDSRERVLVQGTLAGRLRGLVHIGENKDLRVSAYDESLS
jgi:hypothetical protein